ncbi:MAG: phosphatase PAP2 family protein [Phycisphaeraceae bacterium]|nr:phosphatase PAP2 family protein [Phycisphaeraceae bacterium]
MTSRRSHTLGLWIIGIALAMCWDRACYLALRPGGPFATAEESAAAKAVLESHAWYQTFYVLGRLWPWLIVAAAMVLADVGGGSARAARGIRRALFLLAGAGLGGAATEAAKIVFRRLRPELTDGYYGFRPLWENFWSGSNLGLPSSHAGVAFGAAFAMCCIFPRASLVFLAAAITCALSRVLAGAHFLSDVVVGAFIAYWIVEGMRRATRPRPATARA